LSFLDSFCGETAVLDMLVEIQCPLQQIAKFDRIMKGMLPI